MLYSWVQRPRQVDGVYIHFLNMYYVYTGYTFVDSLTWFCIPFVRFQQQLLPRKCVVCVLVLSNF